MRHLGTAKLDNLNRVRIPNNVMDELPKGNRVSFDKDELTGNICIFIGVELFNRTTEDSNKEDTSQTGNVSGEREEKDVLSPGGVFGGEDVSPPDDSPPPNYCCKFKEK